MKEGLKTRIGTAIVFGIVMIGGIFGGPFPFLVLFVMITTLSLLEFTTISLSSENQAVTSSRRVIGIVFGLIPILLVTALKMNWVAYPDSFLMKGFLAFIPLFFLVFLYELYAASKTPYQNIAFIGLGLIYIGIPFAMLVYFAIDGANYYGHTVFGLLLLTWTNDTAAYFVGSKFGKTPLFPRISPKKTWEGSIGGVIGALLVGILLSYIIKEQTMIQWMVLAVIVAIFGSLGDLVESMLKRSKGIKDSGTLLPGHGGFLDRFDAFIFLLPFAMTYLLWTR